MAEANSRDTSPVMAFCADLKELRRVSGRDLASIAREITVSGAQLYAVLDGEVKRPPDWTRLVEPFVRACGGTDAVVADWRRRHDILVGVHEELRRLERQADPPVPVIPAQLPATVAAFSGRSAELSRLDLLLPNPADPMPGAAVVISAVSGTAGVGKPNPGN
jgi:hypothetical protein